MRFVVVLSLLVLMACWPSYQAKEEQVPNSREKRFVYYPGTKWCGAGNRARNYYDLGRNRKADKCCRTHDKCAYSIPAGKRKWRLLNLSLSTISHCSCDNKFYRCLKSARTTAARNVGKLFFNSLRTKCFLFRIRRVCVKRGWWLRCTRHRNRIIAVKKSNKKF